MINGLPILLGWSAAMAVSLGFAMQSQDAATSTGSAIARLAARQGTVQFRQEGVSLWLDVGAKQTFADGTLLATGGGSSARIAFLDGREILLGESSQVVLTLGRGAEIGDSVVTLLKGSLETKKTAQVSTFGKSPRRLIINSGNKSVALAAPEDTVEVKKVIGAETPKIAMLGGVPKLSVPALVKPAPPVIPLSKLAIAGPEPVRFAA